MIEIPPQQRPMYMLACRVMAALTALAASAYLVWLLFIARADNAVLFVLLVLAEVFNLAQASGFWYTIWKQRWSAPHEMSPGVAEGSVDVFITVCGEPPAIVERTVSAAALIRHPRKTVWVLDDGASEDVREIAGRYGAQYVRRSGRSGAKAGNINNALAISQGDFVLVLDADHVPVPEFLERTLTSFDSERVAFVQTPQVYSNAQANRVAAGANAQQALFYGPILRGRAGCGAVFSCGTNVVFSRAALESVGGMPEDSITEDLRISLMLERQGWEARYVPEVLARGLGPCDVASYTTQQSRWARGGLEILFRKHPFSRRMSLRTRLQYLLGFQYWFTGLAYGIYLLLPIAYFLFGLRPIQVPNQYPAFFLPYILLTFTTLVYASNFRLTARGIWFTLASFPIHIGALVSVLAGRKTGFVVTPKTASHATLRPVLPHLAVSAALILAAAYGVLTKGFNPSTANNLAFTLGHLYILTGFVWYSIKPGVRTRRGPSAAVTGRSRRSSARTSAEPVNGLRALGGEE